MKEYLKIIDEIIALVGLHLIPKFVNLYQGQVDIRCEENDTGVLINIIVSLPDKNELQALQNQVGMDSLQAKQILEGILKLEKMDSCKPLENRQLELKRIWLNKLVSVLEEHMENTEFNVAMLCQLLGMNRKLLYRKIKQLTGVTPVSLIRRVRMIRAATLLLQGRFTVSEVMYMVGYSNPSYFSRCFMAEYNISPSRYAIIQKNRWSVRIRGHSTHDSLSFVLLFLYQSLQSFPIDFAHVAKPGYWLSILFLSVTGVNPSIGISIANGYAPLRSI